MNSLSFDFEWEDPAEAKGAELRATWARFSIIVDHEPIIHVYDGRSRGVRKAVYLPLYPLAEWLAAHWWFLLYEVDSPGRPVGIDYARRHDLRFAREGFAIPSLLITPLGDSVRLQWQREELPHCGVEFLRSGHAQVGWVDFKEAVTRLIQAVTARLDESNVTDTLLADEWRAVETASKDEAAFCAAAAALGLDPFAIEATYAEAIIEAEKKLPPAIACEFFAAADYSTLSQQVACLDEALNFSRSNKADLQPLKVLRSKFHKGHVQGGSPWEQGYEVARQLRKALDLNGQPLADVAAALRVPTDAWSNAVVTMPNPPGFFDTVIDVNSDGSPGFVLGGGREEKRRKFALCRGIFEYLTSQEGEPSLATRARSDRQQRNRAFAAEFLVPATALRERVRGLEIGEEDIDELAAEFGVSTFVVRHQIENHGIASVSS